MSTFRVVVTDQVFPDIEIERALIEQAGGTIEVASGTREEVLATIESADALLNTYFPMDADVIGSLKNCKIIARYGIGVDNCDLEAAKAAGIAITNVPDYCVEEVGVHTVAMILSLIRKLPQGDVLVKAGEWGSVHMGEIRRLSTMTIGLLGYGRIGSYVADAMHALGADVIVYDPYVSSIANGRLVALPELFEASDVLSVHCPATPETIGMINATTLATMKPSSYVVNCSRGPIINLADLVDALKNGVIAGAGLDVFETEPPSAPLIEGTPHLLATPHSAFLSVEALQESQKKAATQILKCIAGDELDYRIV
jgi:D-3-phosphoglycerate dehydrogenase